MVILGIKLAGRQDAAHHSTYNRVEDPDINPHTHEHLIFDKEAKIVQWKIESIFNKWC